MSRCKENEPEVKLEEIVDLLKDARAKKINLGSEFSNDFLNETLEMVKAFLDQLGLRDIINISYNITQRSLNLTLREYKDEAFLRYVEPLKVWIDPTLERQVDAFLHATRRINELRREIKSLKEEIHSRGQDRSFPYCGPQMIGPMFPFFHKW